MPRKNIRLLAGKPLIAWTIETAWLAGSLDRVVVSTEDPEIADVARRCGAEVPFTRPWELARDGTPGTDPVIHAAQWLEEHEGYHADYVMLLQPTSPLRAPEDINESIRLALKRRADGLVSVCEAAHAHPYLAKQMKPGGQIKDFLTLKRRLAIRQQFPAVYVVNGAIYLASRDSLLRRRSFYGTRTYGYLMPPERSLDIDTPWEFHLAELILKEQERHGHD